MVHWWQLTTGNRNPNHQPKPPSNNWLIFVHSPIISDWTLQWRYEWTCMTHGCIGSSQWRHFWGVRILRAYKNIKHTHNYKFWWPFKRSLQSRQLLAQKRWQLKLQVEHWMGPPEWSFFLVGFTPRRQDADSSWDIFLVATKNKKRFTLCTGWHPDPIGRSKGYMCVASSASCCELGTWRDLGVPSDSATMEVVWNQSAPNKKTNNTTFLYGWKGLGGRDVDKKIWLFLSAYAHTHTWKLTFLDDCPIWNGHNSPYLLKLLETCETG